MTRKSDFNVIRALGRGSFGVTFLINEVSSGKELVCKRMTLVDENDRRMALDEAEMLRSNQNEFLVQFIGSFEEKDEFFLLMEYCDKGDLRKYMIQLKEWGAFVSEDKLWDLFAQMSEALHSLHSKNIIHRDLKPENVFLTKKMQVKLGDLEMARIEASSTGQQTKIGGTTEYQPPELLSEDEEEDSDDLTNINERS
ncbi:MAG: putative NEK protein kinase [Streblomastix strix]|uniref:non-specific serine/threonine protein kinase n=1 Tax=Streblomastix strix TaxID=222440 RepID=A0A5J4U411_9EUKA|nr:MAG: putative NEK protein kinase [Streblomastix strix]